MRPGVLERESSVVRSIPTRTVFKTQEDILEAVSGISHQITQVSTDLETKIESLASAPGNHTETPGESTPVVDIDTTEITSTLGEIKSALTDEEAGLSKQVSDMRLAIDGNGDQELESLMKRVAGLETAVSTMQTTMYAMREVDRILEGVQLPNQDEAMIRTHYLNMVRVNKLTDPIKIAQYTGQWTHRHRGHCDVTMHVPLGTEMVLTDLTVISVTTDLQEGLHLGICTPTVSWYGYQSSGIQLTNLLSSYYLVDEYYFRDRENPTTSLLLAVIGADQGEPNPPTNDEAEALMVKLGYPAYTGAPGDSEAKEAYMKYARIIAQIRAYTMMAGNGTVDDGVPYWYMIYQPPNAPKNPFDPLLPPNML